MQVLGAVPARKLTPHVTTPARPVRPAPAPVKAVSEARTVTQAARVPRPVAPVLQPIKLTDVQKKALADAKKTTQKSTDAQKKAQDAQKVAHKAQLASAANHASATAAKLAKHRPQLATKLKNLSAVTSKRAQKITGDVLGDILGSLVTVGADDPNAPQAATVAEQAAQCGDIAAAVAPIVDQLRQMANDAADIGSLRRSRTALADAGDALITRCNVIVDELNKELGNMTGAGAM